MSQLRQGFQFRLALTAALMLLVAQFGAMAHAYSHAPSAAPELKQPLQSAHPFCGDCLNFSPLLTVAGAPAALSLNLTAADPLASAASRLAAAHRSLLAFRCRGPPALSTR